MVLAVEDDRRVARAGSVTPHQRGQRLDQGRARRHPEEADLRGNDRGRARDDHQVEAAQSGGTSSGRHALNCTTALRGECVVGAPSGGAIGAVHDPAAWKFARVALRSYLAQLDDCGLVGHLRAHRRVSPGATVVPQRPHIVAGCATSVRAVPWTSPSYPADMTHLVSGIGAGVPWCVGQSRNVVGHGCRWRPVADEALWRGGVMVDQIRVGRDLGERRRFGSARTIAAQEHNPRPACRGRRASSLHREFAAQEPWARRPRLLHHLFSCRPSLCAGVFRLGSPHGHGFAKGPRALFRAAMNPPPKSVNSSGPQAATGLPPKAFFCRGWFAPIVHWQR